MADIDAEGNPASKSEETSSDDAVSTKSSEVKTSGDVDSLDSIPSLATPASQGSEGEDSSCSQSLLSTAPDTPGVVQGAHSFASAEEIPFITDDAVSTKSSEVKTPDDVGSLDSVPSLTTPANQGSEGEDSSCSQFLLSTSPDIPGVVVGVHSDAPAERNLFIPPSTRRRVKDPSSDAEGAHELQPTTFENNYVVNLFCRCQEILIFLFHSKYFMVPVYSVLLIVSFCAAWLGAAKYYKCPFSPKLPKLTCAVGIVETLVLLFQIMCLINKHVAHIRIFQIVIPLMKIFCFLVICFELYYCSSIRPSSYDKSENYCCPFFLKYSWIHNCFAFSLNILSLSIRGLSFFSIP